jgi:hypothetical protein
LVTTRRAIVVVALVGWIAAVSGCGGSGEDVDRAAYISENRRLLNQIPRFPDVHRVGVRHEATYRVFDYDDGCFFWCGSFIDGYITHVSFRSPSGTTAAEVTRFFELRLPPLGWRRAHWGKIPAGWPHRIHGEPSVRNVGFRSGDAGVSIDLTPFIRGNRIIRGGRFIVNINHGGYRSQR